PAPAASGSGTAPCCGAAHRAQAQLRLARSREWATPPYAEENFPPASAGASCEETCAAKMCFATAPVPSSRLQSNLMSPRQYLQHCARAQRSIGRIFVHEIRIDI